MLQQQKYSNNKRYNEPLIFGLKALDKKHKKNVFLQEKKQVI
jgi:hypothetical protein